jgi:hypothetical protein
LVKGDSRTYFRFGIASYSLNAMPLAYPDSAGNFRIGARTAATESIMGAAAFGNVQPLRDK